MRLVVPEALLDAWAAKSWDARGWYEVNPSDGNPFEIYSYGTGSASRARIRGSYEPDVVAALTSRLSGGMHAWDVGAGWGYFTQLIAATGASVTAFEVEADRCAVVEEGARRNGWADRVRVVERLVDGDLDADEFGAPDLVKVDIEGWEYVAIEALLGELPAEPVWIVEIHEPSRAAEAVPARPGSAVVDLFESAGYSVSSLPRRSEEIYHVVAEPASGSGRG